MSTYNMCKAVILNQKSRGTLDKDSMSDKLTIFLLGDRITGKEYNELMDLMKEDENNVNT